MKFLLLFAILLNTGFKVSQEPAGEKLFKQMIVNRPNHLSSPGATRSITFQEFSIGKVFTRVMEYGYTPGTDKKVKVYPVISRFTMDTDNFNTGTGQKYPSSRQEYRRPYEFYLDRNNKWVCVAVGLSKGMY